MKTEIELLRIMLRMEQLISERSMMEAMNESRAQQGGSQVYDKNSFHQNSVEFGQLLMELEKVRTE